MKPIAKICFLEDDPTIREIVSEKLRRCGYEVSQFESVDPILKCNLEEWDLYIIDILVKGTKSGLDLCQVIRAHSPVIPILILSALGEPEHRIQGLTRGADDYLPKPFETRELILRIERILQRKWWYQRRPQETRFFAWSNKSIDFSKYQGRNGNHVFALTPKECMIMKLLIERQNQVVSRDELLNWVWGDEVYPTHRTIDNFIVRLRRYFEDDPKNPKHICSIRGIGYKFSQ